MIGNVKGNLGCSHKTKILFSPSLTIEHLHSSMTKDMKFDLFFSSFFIVYYLNATFCICILWFYI